jgi:hypothetical protein
MDSLNPQASAATTRATSEGDALVEQLLGLIGGLDSSEGERRLRDRYPICCKMQLVPLDSRGNPLLDELINVFGKDLSRRGISFSHDLPLPFKRCIISFVLGETHQFVVETEVNWTRPTMIGLYESGCRLIRKVSGHRVAERS